MLFKNSEMGEREMVHGLVCWYEGTGAMVCFITVGVFFLFFTPMGANYLNVCHIASS